MFEIFYKYLQNTEQWQDFLWTAWNNNPPIKTTASIIFFITLTRIK